MKRAGNLWPTLVSFENLHRAAMRALRGKRSRPEACDFVTNLESNLWALKRELEENSYTPGKYRTFWISAPKPRLISAAPFLDRVVHHALIQIIEPAFERRFIHHSYACRVGKGNHRALRQFVGWGRRNRYVLKLDIRKFFPSIDHDILKATLRKTIKDKNTQRLCDTIIDGSNAQEQIVQWFAGDDLLTPTTHRRGIPIGNLTSQFFGNVFLDPLDHFIKEDLRVGSYLRYVDDLALFSNDKAELSQWRKEISRFLESTRLRLNEGKSRVRKLKEGVEFLGFVCFPDRLRLSSRNVKAMRRRIKRIVRDYSANRVAWPEIECSLRSWNEHAANGDTWRLRGCVFNKNPFSYVNTTT
ncbi:MAG: RNA-dependent DNA polymerase [Proteobacteria bacterium]|nr:RNA-dependent DNA polymerase [Pseudomonadota bacterium]